MICPGFCTEMTTKCFECEVKGGCAIYEQADEVLLARIQKLEEHNGALADQLIKGIYALNEEGLRAQRAEARIQRLKAALEAAEWVRSREDDFGHDYCPRCHGWKQTHGHYPHCPLQLALAEVGGQK